MDVKSRFSALHYMLLKQVSMGLTIAWGLGFTMVGVRTLGVASFSFMAVLNSIGISLAFVDLGISKVVFITMSRGDGGGRTPDYAKGIFLVYLGLVVFATIGLVIWLCVAGRSFSDVLHAALFFPTCMSGLPWNLVNNVSVAKKRYIETEIAYGLLRFGQIAFLVAIYRGLDLTEAFSGILLIWTIAFGYCGARLDLWPSLLRTRSVLSAGLSWMRHQRQLVNVSIAFILLELAIYQFPILFASTIYGLGIPVLITDVFYKIHRAANAFFRSVSEAQIPNIAHHAAGSDGFALGRVWKSVSGINAIAAAAGCGLFYFQSDRILHLIVGKQVNLPTSLVLVTCAFVLVGAVENAATSVLLNTGHIRALRDADGLMCLSLLVVAAGALWAGISIMSLLAAYTCVFLGMALIKVASARSCIESYRGVPA